MRLAMSQKAPVSEIRVELEKVLHGRQFSRSHSLSRFLRFIVDQTLEGRSDELKEYTIGAQVFERGEGFDPRIDSIVRVQAGKLRRRLEQYFHEDGVADPIRIELPLGGYVPVFHRRKKAPADTAVPTIAVLPFLNLSSDPGFEYFSDGLTEELISQLGRIPGSRVIARTSSFAFKNQSLGLPEIGKKLGASLLLEGSVQRREESIRVTARLAEAAPNRPIWSRRFDGSIADVFTVQDELAAEIARAVRGTESLRPKPHPREVDSYLLVLKAWRLWHSNNPAHLQQAVGYFERAVEADPTNFDAQAGLATALTILAVFYAVPAKEALERGRRAARAAVQHGPDSAEAWGALGAVEATLGWDWTAGEDAFRRALDINPNHALSRHAYAMTLLVTLGRLEDAIREMQIVVRLDPLSVMANCDLGAAYAYAGRYEEALLQYDATLEIEPGNLRATVEQGWALLCAQRVDEGLTLLDSAGRDLPPGLSMMYALGLALADRRQDCLDVLTKMRESTPERHLAGNLAIAALDILGLREEALTELEAAYERRDPHLRYLTIDQHLVRMHDEPRFQAIVRKMGLRLPQGRPSARNR